MRPRIKPYPPLMKSRKSRKWLNEHRRGGSAHITWDVDVPKFNKNKKGGGYISGMWTGLYIADCSRKISLEFDIEFGGRAHALRKIKLLISSLQEFEVAMLMAIEREKELKVIHAKALKKKKNSGEWTIV